MYSIFGYISVILSVGCVIPYIRDILAHKTRPERTSWFIWSVLGFIAFSSQFAKGATDSLWFTAGETTGVSIIFLLSLKFGIGGLGRRDLWALLGAGIGLVLWSLTREAGWAIIFVIIVDAIGAVLTLIKSYEEPETETMSTWVMSGTAGLIGALAVGSFNPILLAYPLYIASANYLTVFVQLLGRRKVKLAVIRSNH